MRDSLTAVWGYVYDNKSYAYDYILDKLNCRDQQARQQKALDDVRRQMSAAQAEGLVDALPDYYIQKCYLTDYEREIARMLGLGLASDSLKQVAVRLQTIDFRLPKPEITERYFLDYEPVQFVAGRYTYKKPIPDCPVYEHGVIYRILLGEYKYKQNISIFRSASPLYVLKGATVISREVSRPRPKPSMHRSCCGRKGSAVRNWLCGTMGNIPI